MNDFSDHDKHVIYLWSLLSEWWMEWPGRRVSALPHPNRWVPLVCPLPVCLTDEQISWWWSYQQWTPRYHSGRNQHSTGQICKLPNTNKRNGTKRIVKVIDGRTTTVVKMRMMTLTNTAREREWKKMRTKTLAGQGKEGGGGGCTVGHFVKCGAGHIGDCQNGWFCLTMLNTWAAQGR